MSGKVSRSKRNESSHAVLVVPFSTAVFGARVLGGVFLFGTCVVGGSLKVQARLVFFASLTTAKINDNASHLALPIYVAWPLVATATAAMRASILDVGHEAASDL